jgi:hypothetical protein
MHFTHHLLRDIAAHHSRDITKNHTACSASQHRATLDKSRSSFRTVAMQQIASDDNFLDCRVRACGMCKYYLLSLRRRGQSRRVGVGYFASNQEARAWAESVRESVSSFTLIEMPALFFHVDDGTGRAQHSEGLLIADTATWRPLAKFGAAALDDLSVRSVMAQFERPSESRSELLLRYKTSIDMPALIRPLRAWGSRKPRTQKSTTLLNWRVENGAVAIDTSHIESLCMRFAQQIRWLRRGFVGGLPRASEP